VLHPFKRRLAGLGVAGALCVVALSTGGAARADVSGTLTESDLSVTVSTPGPVLAGVTENYTITVTNTGTTPLPSVDTLVDLPDGLTLKSVSANCARNPLGGNSQLVARCSFGNLAPGAGGTAVVGLLAPTPGTDTLDVTGIYQIPLSSGFEIFATPLTLNVPVSPGPTDVQVTGSSNNGSPPVGQPFQYSFQVKDNGPQVADGVIFDDTLPASMQLVGVSASVGSCSNVGNAIHCDVGTLATGQQSNIVITAIPTAVGSVTDAATIGMTGLDTHPANDTVGVTVQPR
jgi:uncharacterized repeat protein (TIGR01451 family)